MVDPRPNQSLRAEISERTGLTVTAASDDWSMLSDMVKERVVTKRLHSMKSNELILARDAQNHPLLVIKKYRDNWVIFRPNIGVILSTEATETLMRDVLIVKVTQE